MKIVVIGGRGLIGSKVASKLSAQGHDVVTASRRSGVDSLTGEGLADAVAGADVVVDVADSPLFDDEPVMHFFTTTTRNLLAAEQEAGVEHHVALSVVGSQSMPDSGYNTAKGAQENLIKDSGRPYSIVRATPFYEFVVGLADSATDGDTPGYPPHRLLGGPGFGYMIDGEMLFELEGEAPRVLRAGDAFWGPGGDVIHYQDANNRTDIPCSFLLTLFRMDGQPMIEQVAEEELERRKGLRVNS
jgi:hypothetical protein